MTKMGRQSAIDKALEILFCVADQPRDVGISEVADILGSDKATVFRSLKALEKHGLIEQNEETKKYRLGLRTVNLAGQKLRGMSVASRAQPFLSRLAQDTQETVQLSVRSGDNVLYLSVFETPQPMRVASEVGTLAPLHCTAAGKLFLAFDETNLHEFAARAPLEKRTDKTMTDIRTLQKDIELIRSRGWSMDDEELLAHLRVVAAPIRDFSGKMTAAIAVGGPTPRVSPEKIDEMVKAVLETAHQISGHL
jgi:DNA-binding IclR family transcriptional regulator